MSGYMAGCGVALYVTMLIYFYIQGNCFVDVRFDSTTFANILWGGGSQ